MDSPEEASEEVGWESPVLDDFSADEDSSEEGLDSEEDEEDSLARASAPEGSSPSSPMMAIVFPTVTPLAPSSTWVLVLFSDNAIAFGMTVWGHGEGMREQVVDGVEQGRRGR